MYGGYILPPPTKWTISNRSPSLSAVALQFGTRHDLAIQLHGDAVALHAQLFDQRVQGGRRKVPFFSIDDQTHKDKIADRLPVLQAVARRLAG